jgi:hypothetical protein
MSITEDTSGQQPSHSADRKLLLEYEHLLESNNNNSSSSTTGGRVVYRSLSCSSSYVVLGANTGSLYFYERESFRFLALISCKEIREPIAKLKFGPNSTILSLTTSKNTLFILEINLTNRKEKERVLYKYTHKEGILHYLYSHLILTFDRDHFFRVGQ